MDDIGTRRWFSFPVVSRALAIFLPLMILAALIETFFYQTRVPGERRVLRAEQAMSVELIANALVAALAPTRSDLVFLAHQSRLREWLEHRDPAARARLEADYASFVEAKEVYDQVRIIDARGHEAVWVNYYGGQPASVPEAALQDESARRDLRQLRDLADDEIYVTGLSHNIDHGVVESPLKPVLGFITPVAGGSGDDRPIVTLNFLAAPLLEVFRVASHASAGNYWLVNGHGEWLIGPEPDESVRFYLDDAGTGSFATAFPGAWSAISGGPDRAQFDGHEAIAYQWLDPGRLAGAVSRAAAKGRGDPTGWAVVGHLSRDHVAMAVAQAPRRSALALAGFGVLLAYPSWAIAVSSMHRRKVERALRDSETTYRNLIEMAPDAVLIVNGAGRIILMNSQAEQVFGYSRDELIGRPVEALLPTELRADHEQHRRRFQSNPATRPMGTDLDIRGHRKDGTEIPLEISLSPWQEGSQAGVMAIARDVSLQRSSEREIRRLNGDLQLQTQELLAVNRELEAFSYSVSHDLRAPCAPLTASVRR